LKIFSRLWFTIAQKVTSSEKFNLLALKGQALQLVQGLPVAPENYSIVWNVLVESYENKS